jgi:hypothetical protein
VLSQKIRVLRPTLAIVSIPLLVILDILVLMIPGSNQTDKHNKASMIDSWPFLQSETANRNSNTHFVLNDGRRLRYGSDNLSGGRAEVIEQKGFLQRFQVVVSRIGEDGISLRHTYLHYLQYS